MNRSSAFSLSCLLLFNYFFSFPVQAATTNPRSHPITSEVSITVSAAIGEPKLNVFGYTAPSAQVELRGSRVAEEVTSNGKGYFFFDRVFLPQLRTESTYPELCLITIDNQKRFSFPTCLPPLPFGLYEITVGPVLLPPTISLEQGNFLPGEQIAARGQTIPDSKVAIFLANNFPLQQGLIPSAYAHFLPSYQIRSNSKGEFEFNLPAEKPATWRLFAAARYLGSPTPKSNSLTFKVLNWWQRLWERIKAILGLFLGFLKPHLWQLFILAEIIVIFYLLWRHRRSKKSTEANLHSLR